MNRIILSCVVAALLAAPLAIAHEPAGTPKNYCEPPSEWNTHDWNSDPPSTRFSTKGIGTESGSTTSHSSGDPKYQWPYMDGNLGGDCSGAFNLGTPCAGWEDPHDPLSFYAGLCDFDPFVADFDGHKEFGYVSHALLLACDVACGWSGLGAGAQYCWHEGAHHPPYPYVSATDIVLGSGTAFTVYADHMDWAAWWLGLPEDPCGDFQFDWDQDCVGSCPVAFGPGLDGAYHVVVQGVQGHVWT